ncbi:long-chain fatty acid--CoA ligase [soil metagenome]
MVTDAPTPTLLTDRIEHWARTTPDAVALIYAERTWTFGEWNRDITATAAALRISGVGPGDSVAVLDKNHPSCLLLTFAAATLGAANAVLNWRLSADELIYVINNSRARILFVGPDFTDTVEAIRTELSYVATVIVVGGERDGFEAWLAPGREQGSPVEKSNDAGRTCLLLYTSGTTGYPKGACLSHANIIAHTTSVCTVFHFSSTDRNLVAMPLFHVGGSCYAMFGFHVGVPTILTREPDAAALFGALAAGATHAFLVPAVIAAIVQGGDRAIAAMRQLRYLGYGASPMPLPLLRRVLVDWPDANFIQVYGMTELSGVVTTLNPADHRDPGHPERLASAGTPIPGVEMRIVDPVTGDDVAPGEPGELWFRTAQAMTGYLDNPEATAATITAEGWLRSGDIGQLDAGGYVSIVDRVKDMIISGGENIYSPEVERVLGEHPAVAEVAVIGVPDEQWGEAVRAIVAPYPGGVIDPAELIEFCRLHLAHYKCPRQIDVLESLPRNGTGKIMKRALRRPFWQDRDRNV